MTHKGSSEDGVVEIKTKTGRFRVPLKYVAVLLSLLGLPATGTFLGTMLGKPAEAVTPAPASPAQATVSPAEFAAHQKDDDRQDEYIGDLLMKQAADHDAITTLTVDVRHIKDTVDRIDQSLRRQRTP
ncbi:MAG: hypothetical protein EHM35_03490 [Planctomycetaceae bacterium]|nr:MAG: hypothetical protein EHM35_03490 [Planctomycetaceae bacterium]